MQEKAAIERCSYGGGAFRWPGVSYAGNWVTAGRSGGGLRWRLSDLDAVTEPDTPNDLRQQVLALQPAPGFGGRHDELEDHQPGGVLRQRALGPHRAVPDGGEHALDGVGGAQMVPVLGREVVEGEQRVAVLGQAGDRLLVFGPVLLGKGGDRRL